MANTNDLFSIATGYFGSAYLDSTSSNESVDGLSETGEAPHHVVAITMLSECTFHTLTAYKEASKFAAYVGVDAAANGAFGKALVSTDTFPTGVTIYGRWTAVTLETGKCIAYVAPASGAHPGLNVGAA